MRIILVTIMMILSTVVYAQDIAQIDSFALRYQIGCSQINLGNKNEGIISLLSLTKDLKPHKSDTTFQTFYRDAYLSISKYLIYESLYVLAYPLLDELRNDSMSDEQRNTWETQLIQSAYSTMGLIIHDTLNLKSSYESERMVLADILQYSNTADDSLSIQELYYDSYRYEAAYLQQHKRYQEAIDKLTISYEWYLSVNDDIACADMAMVLQNLYMNLANITESAKIGYQCVLHCICSRQIERAAKSINKLLLMAKVLHDTELFAKVDQQINRLFDLPNLSQEALFWLNAAKGNTYLYTDPFDQKHTELAELWYSKNTQWILEQADSCPKEMASEHYANLANISSHKHDTLNTIHYLSNLISIERSRIETDNVDMFRLVPSLVSLSQLYQDIGQTSHSKALSNEAYEICSDRQDPYLWRYYWSALLVYSIIGQDVDLMHLELSSADLQKLTSIADRLLNDVSTEADTEFIVLVYLTVFPLLKSHIDAEKMAAYITKLSELIERTLDYPTPDRLRALSLLLMNDLDQNDRLQAIHHAQLLYNGFNHILHSTILYEENPRLFQEISTYLSSLHQAFRSDEAGDGDSDLITELGFNASQLTKSFILRASVSLRQWLLDKGEPEDLRLYTDIQNAYITKSKIYQSGNFSKDELIDLDSKINKWENELMLKAASYGDYSQFIDLDHSWVKQSLADNEYLIDFATTNSDLGELYIMYLTDNQMQHPKRFWLFSEDNLKRAGIEMSLDFYDPTTMEALVEIIWNKLARHINKPSSTIYYIPTHKFYQIDLSSLVLPDGTLLGDHYNIVRLSSADQLKKRKAVLQLSNQSDSQAVIVGGLSYDMTDEELLAENQKHDHVDFSGIRSVIRGNALSYLPQTKREAYTIDQLLKGKGFVTKLLTGIEGTAESFYEINHHAPQLLHIATHGFYYLPGEAKETSYFKGLDDAMDLSGIVFAGANAAWTGKEIPEGVHPGIVTASEIAAMDLSGLELVVLSACQTGEGKTTDEGLYGLQRAFKKAGAGTIIMSLWPVSDRITREFMETFYRNLLDDRLHGDKHRAFQLTKNEIRKRYPDPIYWAAFVMTD